MNFRRMNKKPYITHSHDVHLDNGYTQWLTELIGRYRHAQIKAAVKVNSEKLLWNWQTGRDLVHRKAEEKWGSGIVEQLSLDLQAAFPDETGFGTSNLWYMKKWYLFYDEKLQRVVGEINTRNAVILQRVVGELYTTNNKVSINSAGHIIDDYGYNFPSLFASVPDMVSDGNIR